MKTKKKLILSSQYSNLTLESGVTYHLTNNRAISPENQIELADHLHNNVNVKISVHPNGQYIFLTSIGLTPVLGNHEKGHSVTALHHNKTICVTKDESVELYIVFRSNNRPTITTLDIVTVRFQDSQAVLELPFLPAF